MDLELNSNAERLAEAAQKFEAFSAINLSHVRGEVAEALVHFGKIGLLEEYTKHDISHIDAMLAMYDWMIPESTKELMTPADWLLTTLATYLHDFGLLVTRDEFDRRDDVEAFAAFRRRIMDNDDLSVRDYRSQVGQLDDEAAERFLYQEFVRAYHAQRIRAWLYENPDPTWGADPRITVRLRQILGSVEETFLDDVGLVCESHHLDDMNDLKKYPLSKPYGRTREEEANVQYAAFLLRTSDLLHITKDRVPSMAAVVINPRNPKSQVEWAKQSAVRSVRPKVQARNPDNTPPMLSDTIEVHASFKEAEGYFGLTAYLNYSQRQLAQTFTWSRENQTAGVSDYVFPWRRIDFSHIEAKGFVTEPFEFSIDQGKILDLLTGHTLYNDTGVVVRELVQNSLDAVRLRAHIDPDDYEPRIDVSWNSADRVLCVVDNGVGMTQSTIEQNFLRVGSSHYQEPDFQKDFPDFSSISRFGIGVLSAFMVADDVSVSTSHESETQARQLSLRDVHGQYLVRLLDKASPEMPDEIRAHGTSVCLKLRPSAELTAVEAILRHWVLFPGCELWLTVDDDLPKKIGFDSVADALGDALVKADMAREGEAGLKTPYGNPIEIRTVNQAGLELAFAVSWSRWLEEWGYVRFDPGRQKAEEAPPAQFGVCVGGVRVTSDAPGFVVGGIAAMANASGKGAPLTNVARSALERTEEYDELLRKVYAGYVGHIADEMHALESTRDASLTRAAQEASFLAEEIVRHEVDSSEILEGVLRTVPAIVIEESGVRIGVSLAQLEEKNELSSMESTTISSFESVLRSIRGARSPSLKNILDALGSDEELPDTPLICGLQSAGLLSRMFTSEWEVTRLESDNDSRTLRATWLRSTDEPRWQRIARRQVLPQAVSSRLERDVALGRSSFDMSWILLPKRDDIEVIGIAKTLVVCQGRMLVLPGNEFLEVEAVSDEVSKATKNWCISWLLANVASAPGRGGRRGFSSGQLFTPMSKEERVGSRWLSRVLEHIRDAGIFELLDEASVRSVVEQADLEPLDVSRWDTRSVRED